MTPLRVLAQVKIESVESAIIFYFLEFETLLANRDAVIQKLSASLNKLMLERKEDAEVSRKLEVSYLHFHLSIIININNVTI